MDVANQMQKVSCHECPLKGGSVLVGAEHAVAPVDDIDCIHILLVLSHAFEGEIGIVGSACSQSYMLVKW